MKKLLKTLLASLVIAPCLLFMAGCGGAKEDVLHANDFSNGNEETFVDGTGYGTIVDNQDGTVTLSNNSDEVSGPFTSFGSANKNISDGSKQTFVRLSIKIDTSAYNIDDYFNVTLAINNAKTADGYSYRNERSLYFRKYSDAFKVGYVFNGSSDELNKEATSNSTAVELTTGTYTLVYDIHKANDGYVKVTMSVLNAEGVAVFTAADCNFVTDDGTPTTPQEMGGVRYLWFSRMNTSVVVDAISISTK